MEQRILQIPPDSANERLDIVLAKLMPEFSRTEIKTWIDTGLVRVEDAIVKAKTKVKGGENVTVSIQHKMQPEWPAQAIPLEIVFEDESLMIINKPAGLVVHPGAGNPDQTLLNALLHHAPVLKDIPRAGILHRLDKNTSGLLIIAKTREALNHISRQLRKRELVREYQTIVYGNLISGGTVDAPIGRNPLERKRMAVVDTGKPAITHYRVMERYGAHTRLMVKLETGRTHQIRVHMSYIRHPIVGDVIYGGRVRLTKGLPDKTIHALRAYKRQALHAYAVGLVHPKTNEMLRFECELPKDMQALIEALQS